MQYETRMARVTRGYGDTPTNPASNTVENDPGLDLANVSALVLEKTELMRKALSGVLKSMGLRDVRTTDSPHMAFQGLSQNPVDLVFCDWSPRLDGIDFLNAIRSHPDTPSPYMPVIMVSAYAEPRYIFKARDNGMTEYLAKPFTAKRVYLRVWEVIMRHRQFIKNGTFFGPDRRRRLMPIKWSERREFEGATVWTAG